MVGVQSVVEGLVRTFGPFLIPVTVFAVGVVGYTVLFLVSRQFRGGDEAGVVNLSAGTPERSATDNDYGASTRGVRPYDEADVDDGNHGDDNENDGGAPDEGTADRSGEVRRHND